MDKAYRGRGLASVLVQFVLNASAMSAANVYVLALEDSCVYWMSQSFTLEENAYLNARINIFPDTHLLRHEGNSEDIGDPEDLNLQETFSEDEDEDSEEGFEDMDENDRGGSGDTTVQNCVLDFSSLLDANNIR